MIHDLGERVNPTVDRAQIDVVELTRQSHREGL
jgi:hypothetical protein